jgi:hypothetical protein
MSATFCAQAQDTSSERNPLKEGAWALQFGISSNFTLTSFQGSTIAFKYQLSDKSALRWGITLNGSTNNANNTASGSVEDTSYGSIPENSSTDAANASFVLQYLWYINPSGPVHFYLGVGPSVSYSYSHSSSDYDNFNIVSENGSSYQGYWERQTSTSNSHQWGIGATGVAGVEWFACQWLSIRAEYSEGIQYQWRPTTSTHDNSYISTSNPSLAYNTYPPISHTETSGTSKGWSLSSSGVSFGLSVYW